MKTLQIQLTDEQYEHLLNACCPDGQQRHQFPCFTQSIPKDATGADGKPMTRETWTCLQIGAILGVIAAEGETRRRHTEYVDRTRKQLGAEYTANPITVTIAQH